MATTFLDGGTKEHVRIQRITSKTWLIMKFSVLVRRWLYRSEHSHSGYVLEKQCCVRLHRIRQHDWLERWSVLDPRTLTDVFVSHWL